MKNQIEIYLDQCIRSFCNVHLNDEYYSICINMKNELINNGSITFQETNIKIWAATIIYAVCYLNDLLPKYITPKIIHDFFGFVSVDVSNRAYSITKGIYHKYYYWSNNNNKFNNQNSYNNSSSNNKYEKNNNYNNSQNSNKENETIKYYSKEHINYCKILELDNNFTKEQLKAKYRELMKKFHPDLIQNKNSDYIKIAENKSKEINKAYEFLNEYINN